MNIDLQLSFDPFPTLESEKIYLRRPELDDIPMILRLRSDPRVMQYIPRPYCQNADDARKHLEMFWEGIQKNTSINWILHCKHTSQAIGIIGFVRIHPEHYRAEIGYMLDPDFFQRGYTSAATQLVVEYGFRVMNLHSIEAIIDPDNIGSEKVLLKNGFQKEAHLHQNEYWQGTFLDTIIYSKINPYHLV